MKRFFEAFCWMRFTKRKKLIFPVAQNPIIWYTTQRFVNGEVAQLVEHHVRNVGVVSSNLIFSTIEKVRIGLRIVETHFF